VFSVDGATKESFEAIRVLSNFDQVIGNYRAISALKAEGKTRAGTTIRILCALQRGNMRDFRAMYLLWKSLPGNPIFNLVPVFDFDPDGRAYQSVVPSKNEVPELLAEIDAAIEKAPKRDERKFYVAWRAAAGAWLENVGTNRVNPETNHASCAVPWFSTYIDAKGRVYPCCYLTATPHVMGNIHDKEFREIWHGDTYSRFRREVAHNRPNLEGCRTCPRNDKSVMRALKRLRPLLGNDPAATGFLNLQD
jgi:radical SAM protein with 4Fe4S-binding SPASM domain